MLGLAGILAAAQLPVMSSILTSVYSIPSTRRHCVFTIFLTGGNTIAVIFGGIGSGLAATYARDWRASFVYIAMLLVVVLVVAVFAIPNLRKDGPYPEDIVQDPEEQNALLTSGPRSAVKKTESRTDWKSIVKSIDWLGLFFLLTGVGCFSAALTLVPDIGWRSPLIVVMFVYGAICVFGFRAWEMYTDTPMVPRSMWQSYSLLLVSCTLSFCIRVSTLLPRQFIKCTL